MQEKLKGTEASTCQKFNQPNGPVDIIAAWNTHWVINEDRTGAHANDLENPDPNTVYVTTDLKDCLTCIVSFKIKIDSGNYTS